MNYKQYRFLEIYMQNGKWKAHTYTDKVHSFKSGSNSCVEGGHYYIPKGMSKLQAFNELKNNMLRDHREEIVNLEESFQNLAKLKLS